MGQIEIEIEYKTVIDRVRNGLCPVCGQSNVDYSGDSEYGDPCYQDASCLDCESRWSEHYILNDVEIIETVDRDVNILNSLGEVKHIPEILETLLTQKKMLPAFLGIDNELDRLITEKLKET